MSIKEILLSVGSLLAGAVLTIGVVVVMGVVNSSGFTHFSGISVGEDGFEVTDSGSIDFSGAGTVTLSPTTTQGSGTTLQEIVISGSFADATTTIFARQNPFSATSTCILAELDITNGTSTSNFNVGSSTNQYPVSISATALIASTSVATSVPAVIANDMAYADASGTTADSGANKMTLLPTEWIVGLVKSSLGGASGALVGGVTGGDNTFSGSYKIKCIR